uniref:NADH-ubiquinone oxidoreductase chain 4L n=1 Tax=Trinodes hirtus TaxID=442100 RepID=S4SV72_9COLE|nr:NADH dehydrogenase subunit 4L [Trinodes hirtus]
MLIYVFMILFFSGIFSFVKNRKHLLTILLSLEVSILALFSLIYLVFGFYEGSMYFCMVFLSMSVCEGSLGLSVLVSLIRTHGSDSFRVFNLLW